MACTDELARMERRLNKLVIQEEKTGKARAMTGESAATISKILPGKKMDRAPLEAVENIQPEKMREVLVVVDEALETKNKGSRSRQALVETGKVIDNGQKEALVALVETGKEVEHTERSAIDKIFDEWKWVGDDIFEDTSDDVDEEVLKLVDEMQERLTRMWDDGVKRLIQGGVEFADPHCC